MAKKRVFVSFDYDDDRNYKYLLNAWDANSNFDFLFSDLTPSEIQSWRVDRIKAVLTRKIREATTTLVIVGKNANKQDPKSAEIGYRNWINFEVAKSKENRNKLVGVKLDKNFQSPDELLNSGASWAMSFTQDAIIKALNNA
ncbi:MAG: TIR domain-containing protein [Chloroflexi bacterium]|nr:TIR domain-containing protein [Chloroflexota bacterium]